MEENPYQSPESGSQPPDVSRRDGDFWRRLALGPIGNPIALAMPFLILVGAIAVAALVIWLTKL